jgi:hypothetical protein
MLKRAMTQPDLSMEHSIENQLNIQVETIRFLTGVSSKQAGDAIVLWVQ